MLHTSEPIFVIQLWNSSDTRRVWKLRAPAYGLNDAPVAVHRPLRKYSVNSAESLPSAGLRFEASSFDPRLFYVFRKSGEAIGAIATRIDGILGRGVPDLFLKARRLPENESGNWGSGESPVHVDMELAQEKDSPCDVDPGELYGEPETPFPLS